MLSLSSLSFLSFLSLYIRLGTFFLIFFPVPFYVASPICIDLFSNKAACYLLLFFISSLCILYVDIEFVNLRRRVEELQTENNRLNNIIISTKQKHANSITTMSSASSASSASSLAIETKQSQYSNNSKTHNVHIGQTSQFKKSTR